MDSSPRGNDGTPVPPPAGESPRPEPDRAELAFRLGASGRERDYFRIGAGIAAGIAILLIVVFSVTDLSRGFLPMEDRYLEILIPESEEGTLPFALDQLSNVLEENRISVSGRMTNTSLEPVENVMAVITARETTGRFPEIIEVPVEPAVLEPGRSGSFSVSVTLRQRPDNYSVRFRLENGPFVPHSDEREFLFDAPDPAG
jgi:hypothetical protein